MIYVIFAIAATLAYQTSGEGKSPQELDEKVRTTEELRKTNPYIDRSRR